MKKERCNLSVIFPTYECRKSIECSIANIHSWLDLADEVIIVDSHSSDSSGDFLAQAISHPNIKVLKRPRGLYESWNAGIAESSGKYIYISTAGDTITLEHLKHLMSLIKESEADVVISPPQKILPYKNFQHNDNWLINNILKNKKWSNYLYLNGKEIEAYSFLFCPSGFLGSSASNLYRGSTLRNFLFPTEYGHQGDIAWSIRYGSKVNFAITPQIGSTFLVSEKSTAQGHQEFYRLYKYMLLREICLKNRPLKKYVSIPLSVIFLIKKNYYWLARKKNSRNILSPKYYINTSSYLFFRSLLGLTRFVNLKLSS